MRKYFKIFIYIIFFHGIVFSQLTPEFLLPIIIEDSVGNTDTFWYGYDSRARWDTINTQLGEELAVESFDSILDIKGFHGDDRSYFKYPSKTIVAHTEGRFCPFAELIYLYVKAKYYPLTIRYDSSAFPMECYDYRSEIISRSILPGLGHPWYIAPNYTCMSFVGTVIDRLEERDTIQLNISDSFDINNGNRELLHGFMIVSYGFGECKQLVSTNNISYNEIIIFQNPVDNLVTIDDRTHTLLNKNWSIKSSSGRIIKSGILESNKIEVGELSSGMYFLVFKVENAHFFGKFLKI